MGGSPLQCLSLFVTQASLVDLETKHATALAAVAARAASEREAAVSAAVESILGRVEAERAETAAAAAHAQALAVSAAQAAAKADADELLKEAESARKEAEASRKEAEEFVAAVRKAPLEAGSEAFFVTSTDFAAEARRLLRETRLGGGRPVSGYGEAELRTLLAEQAVHARLSVMQ